MLTFARCSTRAGAQADRSAHAGWALTGTAERAWAPSKRGLLAKNQPADGNTASDEGRRRDRHASQTPLPPPPPARCSSWAPSSSCNRRLPTWELHVPTAAGERLLPEQRSPYFQPTPSSTLPPSYQAAAPPPLPTNTLGHCPIGLGSRGGLHGQPLASHGNSAHLQLCPRALCPPRGVHTWAPARDKRLGRTSSCQRGCRHAQRLSPKLSILNPKP